MIDEKNDEQLAVGNSAIILDGHVIAALATVA
jgi:hypothetical protein